MSRITDYLIEEAEKSQGGDIEALIELLNEEQENE